MVVALWAIVFLGYKGVQWVWKGWGWEIQETLLLVAISSGMYWLLDRQQEEADELARRSGGGRSGAGSGELRSGGG
jgi:hypothetical protein